MAEPAEIRVGEASATDGKQMDLLITLAKDQVKEAYDVAQALEGKARSLVQVSTVFFAASQTAVAVQVAITTTANRPTWVAIVATIVGLAGVLGLAMAAHRTVQLQEPSEQLSVNVETLTKRLVDFAERGDPRVSRFILGELGTIAADRRTQNAGKITKLDKVQFWAYMALGASTLALFFGLVVSFIYR